MPISNAVRLNNQLVIWAKAMATHLKYIISMEKKLEKIIQRNSIADIAAKVEFHQTLIEKMTVKIEAMLRRIQEQKKSLFYKNEFISDDEITDQIISQQNNLLEYFNKTEKEFSEIKYYCVTFLSEIYRK